MMLKRAWRSMLMGTVFLASALLGRGQTPASKAAPATATVAQANPNDTIPALVDNVKIVDSSKVNKVMKGWKLVGASYMPKEGVLAVDYVPDRATGDDYDAKYTEYFKDNPQKKSDSAKLTKQDTYLGKELQLISPDYTSSFLILTTPQPGMPFVSVSAEKSADAIKRNGAGLMPSFTIEDEETMSADMTHGTAVKLWSQKNYTAKETILINSLRDKAAASDAGIGQSAKQIHDLYEEQAYAVHGKQVEKEMQRKLKEQAEQKRILDSTIAANSPKFDTTLRHDGEWTMTGIRYHKQQQAYTIDYSSNAYNLDTGWCHVTYSVTRQSKTPEFDDLKATDDLLQFKVDITIPGKTLDSSYYLTIADMDNQTGEMKPLGKDTKVDGKRAYFGFGLKTYDHKTGKEVVYSDPKSKIRYGFEYFGEMTYDQLLGKRKVEPQQLDDLYKKKTKEERLKNFGMLQLVMTDLESTQGALGVYDGIKYWWYSQDGKDIKEMPRAVFVDSADHAAHGWHVNKFERGAGKDDNIMVEYVQNGEEVSSAPGASYSLMREYYTPSEKAGTHVIHQREVMYVKNTEKGQEASVYCLRDLDTYKPHTEAWYMNYDRDPTTGKLIGNRRKSFVITNQTANESAHDNLQDRSAEGANFRKVQQMIENHNGDAVVEMGKNKTLMVSSKQKELDVKFRVLDPPNFHRFDNP